MAEVSVTYRPPTRYTPPTWVTCCTDHGAITLWADPYYAAWAAIGHAAAHHPAQEEPDD